MTDCATIPRWCLPIAVPDAEWEFEVAFSAGPSPDFTATVLAGAYYMDGSGDSSDLIAVTEAALNSADGDGTWTVERDEERIRFARNGQVGDVLSFGWPSPDVAQIYGYDIDPLEVVTNDGDYEQKGLFRARYCWTPDELLEEDDVTPLAEAVGAITPDGDAIVDGLGERGIMNHMIRLVPAALVKQSYTNQLGYANYVGDTEHGHPVSLADPNAALQKFWTFCRVLAGPIPPVIRYAADRDTPSSFVKCMWPEVEFLSDFDGVASIDTRQPLTYQIKIRGQLTSDEVVRPSGAWSDVCDSGGGGEPTEYDTLWLAAQAELDSVILVNQVAAGNAPAIAYKAVRVDEPWFFEPHPMLGNRWLPGKIDSQVGAPGSGRFLVYRAQSGAAFSINASLHLDVQHSASSSLHHWMNGTTQTTGVEVAIPMRRGGSCDIVADCPDVNGFTFIGGGTFTNSDWLGVLLLVRSSAASVQSYGVYAGVNTQVFTSTNYNDYKGLPLRLQWSAVYRTPQPPDTYTTSAGYATTLNKEGIIGATAAGISWLDDSNDEAELVRAFVASYGIDADYTIQTIGAVNPLSEQGFGGVPT